MCDAVWREMVGLRPKRLVPPYGDFPTRIPSVRLTPKNVCMLRKSSEADRSELPAFPLASMR